MTKVRSFQDYLTRIRQVAEAATPATALRFCAWTLRRFPELFGDDVWDGLTPAETGSLREMLRTFDLAASKSFPLGAQARLQLRLEAFNLFNRANFTAPNGLRTSSAFGTITSTLDPRQLQLGVKVLW